MFEKVKKVASKLMYAVPVAVFLGFVFYITAMSYTGALKRTVEGTNWSFGSFVALSNKFENTLQNGVYKKYGFINLNGMAAKYLGLNTLNQRQKLKNGHLTWFSQVVDVSESARRVTELRDFLAKKGILLFYVLVPDKNSAYDVSFAPGYGDRSRENKINMVNLLRSSGINVLDMNAWFEEHHWHMNEVFFKTDHHWTPQAGLVAARLTMEQLQQLGTIAFDEEKLQEENYKINILKNWFLGSHGKRTGKQYAGLDDIAVYYPNFKTDYSYSGLTRNTTNWNYSNSLLRQDLLKRKDYFNSDPYCIYLYGDLPIQIISNTEAVNQKRLLVTGNSVRRVWQYFISTQFQQLYSLDIPNYTDGTFAQYVEETKPDIVVVITNVNSLSSRERFDFGVRDYTSSLAKTNTSELGALLGNFEISAKEKDNNSFVSIASNLDAGQTYTLTVKDIMAKKAKHIQFTLQNLTSNKAVVNHYFDAAEEGTQKWIFTVPHGSDNYGIYLYAGTKGRTASVSVRVTDILLQKGICED